MMHLCSDGHAKASIRSTAEMNPNRYVGLEAEYGCL
jgi:hypothetical protein